VHQTSEKLELSKIKARGEGFAEETIITIINTLRKLKEKVDQLGGKCELSGFATAVFRDAPNSEIVTRRIIDELGIRIKVITSEEEGHLGFKTAAIISQVATDKMIVWDSGAGGTQLMKKNGDNIEVVSREGFGGQVIANKIKEKLNKSQLHPINQKEYTDSLEWIQKDLDDLPTEWDLQGCTVVALGAFSNTVRKDGQFTTLEKIEQAARCRCDKTENELDPDKSDSQEFHTGSHILSAAVMRRYGIEEARYIDTAGNTTAWLVKSD